MAINRKLVASVVTIVGSVYPVVVKYLKEHPEIGEDVQKAVTKLLAKRVSGPAGMLTTIAALREQVTYLRASADDEAEALRAQEWSRRLDNLQHAAEVLHERGSRREKKAVKEKVMAVRGEILAAFIAEKAGGDGPRQLER